MTERNPGDEDSNDNYISDDDPVTEAATSDEILFDAVPSDETMSNGADGVAPDLSSAIDPEFDELLEEAAEAPGAASGGSDPTPPPPQPAWVASNHEHDGIRRLWRSRADRRVGGVAGGVANYLGVDPTIVRIIFLVLAFTGVAIVVYLAAWIIIPAHPGDEREVVWSRSAVGQQQTALIVGVAAVCLAIVIVSGSWTLFALSLVAGGVWLLSQQDERTATATFSSTVPQPEAAFAGSGFRDPVRPSTSGPTIPPPPQWEAPQHREPRPPQRVTRLVLSLLALLAALSIAAASGDWWDVDATRMVGIGVVIVGVGVVVSSVTTLGGRWLVPLGIVGLLLLLPVNVIDDVVDDGIGDPTYRPTALADLEDEYRHGAGVLTVDLREIDLDGQARSIDVELGVGEVLVIVPSDMGGTAELHAGVGEVESAERGRVRISDGVDVDLGRIRLPGSDGTLDLNIDVGLGVARIEVD